MFESDNWEDFPLREGDYVTGHSLNNENDDDNQCVTTKTHGSIWRDLLLLILFSTTLGFVYLITNLSNQRLYIGRKVFWFHRKLLERNEESNKRVIGSGIMGLVTN